MCPYLVFSLHTRYVHTGVSQIPVVVKHALALKNKTMKEIEISNVVNYFKNFAKISKSMNITDHFF